MDDRSKSSLRLAYLLFHVSFVDLLDSPAPVSVIVLIRRGIVGSMYEGGLVGMKD